MVAGVSVYGFVCMCMWRGCVCLCVCVCMGWGERGGMWGQYDIKMLSDFTKLNLSLCFLVAKTRKPSPGLSRICYSKVKFIQNTR